MIMLSITIKSCWKEVKHMKRKNIDIKKWDQAEIKKGVLVRVDKVGQIIDLEEEVGLCDEDLPIYEVKTYETTEFTEEKYSQILNSIGDHATIVLVDAKVADIKF